MHPLRGPRPYASRPLQRPRPGVEPLEVRRLLALVVQIDYSLDTNNFFDTPEKRAIFQAAADQSVSRFGDTLDAIVPSGSNTWKAVLDHPATGGTVEIPNLTIPANTLRVYAGGRDMSSLGVGGPGGFNSSGSPAWNDLVAARGEPNARGASASDFGPFGGSITFDTIPSGGWYFGLDDDAIGGQNDFYSVALHEMFHLLGFGTSDSWQARVSGSSFTGAASRGEYDGTGNVPLSVDRAHWASGTNDNGRETVMDPELTTGQRKIYTALDLAGMDDIGWELPLAAALTSANSVTASGAASTTFTVTYTHYTAVDTATIGTGDLFVSGPNGFSAPASLENVSPSGKSVTATYSVGAPGGTFDGSDSGTYAVTLMANAVGDGLGNFAPAGSLGAFAVDIDSPPQATLAAQNVTQFGGADHAFTVTYSDPGGIDESSIAAGNLVITRASDGLALVVTSAGITASPSATSRTATYVVAAPGGSWDTQDNGTYAVALPAGQVRDVNGNAADAQTLGTFDVSVGAIRFSAGENVTFTDATGDTVTVSLRGPGTGQVLFSSAGDADASSIVLNDTTPASTLRIIARGGGTSLGELTISGSLRTLSARTTDFAGELVASGSVARIQLRNAGGAISLGSADSLATITLAEARDLSVTSAGPIRSIRATAWLDTDATPDVVSTPALSSLSVRGALQAGIRAGTIGKVSARGELAGAEIRAGESIGSVTAGAVRDSFIFAGVRDDVSTLPQSLEEFSNPAASIRSVKLRGRDAAFIQTRVAAPTVGRAVLGAASIGTLAGNFYGLAADRLTSASGSTTVMGRYRLARRDEPGSGTGVVDFHILIL